MPTYDRQRLANSIRKMKDAGEPEERIRQFVKAFKTKYSGAPEPTEALEDTRSIDEVAPMAKFAPGTGPSIDTSTPKLSASPEPTEEASPEKKSIKDKLYDMWYAGGYGLERGLYMDIPAKYREWKIKKDTELADIEKELKMRRKHAKSVEKGKDYELEKTPYSDLSAEELLDKEQKIKDYAYWKAREGQRYAQEVAPKTFAAADIGSSIARDAMLASVGGAALGAASRAGKVPATIRATQEVLKKSPTLKTIVQKGIKPAAETAIESAWYAPSGQKQEAAKKGGMFGLGASTALGSVARPIKWFTKKAIPFISGIKPEAIDYAKDIGNIKNKDADIWKTSKKLHTMINEFKKEGMGEGKKAMDMLKASKKSIPTQTVKDSMYEMYEDLVQNRKMIYDPTTEADLEKFNAMVDRNAIDGEIDVAQLKLLIKRLGSKVKWDGMKPPEVGDAIAKTPLGKDAYFMINDMLGGEVDGYLQQMKVSADNFKLFDEFNEYFKTPESIANSFKKMKKLYDPDTKLIPDSKVELLQRFDDTFWGGDMQRQLKDSWAAEEFYKPADPISAIKRSGYVGATAMGAGSLVGIPAKVAFGSAFFANMAKEMGGRPIAKAYVNLHRMLGKGGQLMPQNIKAFLGEFKNGEFVDPSRAITKHMYLWKKSKDYRDLFTENKEAGDYDDIKKVETLR